jgi:hypothetical protein
MLLLIVCVCILVIFGRVHGGVRRTEHLIVWADTPPQGTRKKSNPASYKQYTTTMPKSAMANGDEHELQQLQLQLQNMQLQSKVMQLKNMQLQVRNMQLKNMQLQVRNMQLKNMQQTLERSP